MLTESVLTERTEPVCWGREAGAGGVWSDRGCHSTINPQGPSEGTVVLIIHGLINIVVLLHKILLLLAFTPA